MPALKPGMSVGWPLGGQASRDVSPWEGVERAMGADNYGGQTIGGCANRGLGSTPQRSGPYRFGARSVAQMMPPHGRGRGATGGGFGSAGGRVGGGGARAAGGAGAGGALGFDLYGDIDASTGGPKGRKVGGPV